MCRYCEIKMLLLFLFLPFNTATSKCPMHWTVLKKVVEGPWSISSSSNLRSLELTINRITEYQCSDDKGVKFQTSRDEGNVQNIYGPSWFRNDRFKYRFFDVCERDCNSSNVDVYFYYQRYYIGSTWTELGKFKYLYKNCNKLYWTSWVETANCSSSSKSEYRRFCYDCDGDDAHQSYCEGNSSRLENCRPLWGSWDASRPCTVISCIPLAGEQVKKRECLYVDGSKVSDVQLCSNQSAIMTEQCVNINASTECVSDQDGAKSANFYIGVGIAVALIIFLVILLAIFRHIRNKSLRNSAVSQNSRTLDLPVATEPAVALSERNNGFRLGQSTKSEAYDSEKATELHECEIVQAATSTAHELSKPLENQVLNFGQLTEPNPYVLSNTSNEYESVTYNQEFQTQPTKLNPASYTEQRNGLSEDQVNNVYSSLAKSVQLPESDYSTLRPR